MTLKKTSDKISFRCYSIILIFAAIFFCVPLVTELSAYSFSEEEMNILNANNSIGSKSSDELFFLPYIPEVRVNYETITGFFTDEIVIAYRSLFEYFRLIGRDFVNEIQKINITWYQLADGKK